MVYELFPSLAKDKDFEKANVTDIAINKNKTAINLNIEFNSIVKRKKIKKFEKNITKLYDLSRVNISPRYDEVTQEYLETVKEYFIEIRPSVGAFLQDSEWKIEENTIKIATSMDISTFFRNFKIEVENLIRTETGKNFGVELSFVCDDTADFSDARNQTLKDSITNANRAFEEQPKVHKTTENKPKTPYKPRKNALIMQEGEQIILGKPIDQKITNIVDLIEDAGDFLIKGDVFFVETREIPNRDLFVINFDITDYSSSIRVARVMKKELFEEISPQIKVGMHLKVQGILQYSTFDKEFLFRPSAIIASKVKERMDFAPEKRVELHLHSNMSSMDGIPNVKEYVKLAKKW